MPERDPHTTPTIRRTILTNISAVGVAFYVSDALLMLRGFTLARLLGPAVFGVWSSMRLVLLLGRYAQLGSRSGFARLAPLARGAGRAHSAEQFARTASGIAFASAIVTASGIVWLSGRAGTQWGELFASDWSLFAGVLLVALLYEFYIASLWVEQRFHTLSGAHLALAALSTGGGIWAAYRFGLAGFLIALALSYLTVLAITIRFGRPFPRPAFDSRNAGQLLGTGFPIMAGEALLVLLFNIDKLMLWQLGGTKPLGIYSVQSYLTTWAMLLPAAAVFVLYPRLLHTLGEDNDVSRTWPYLESGTRLLTGLACPLLGLLFLTLHLPFRWVLPRYMAAIEPGHWLVLFAFFPLIATMPASIIIALGYQKRLMIVRAFSVIISLICVMLAWRAGYGLVGVALGTALGLSVCALLTLALALRKACLPRTRCMSLLRSLAASYGLMLLVLIAVSKAIPDAPETWTADLLRTLARSAITLAVLGGLAARNAWKLGVFPRFRHRFMSGDAT